MAEPKTLGPETVEEMRSIQAHHRVAPESLINYNRFSKYQRLMRTMGYILRFIARCRGRSDSECRAGSLLSKEELKNAETALWKLVQAEEFPEEISTVRKNQQVPRE